jgi:hypothetical protein
VVEATSLDRVVQLARAVRRHDDERAPPRGDRAELGDRDGEVGQELEQERLELVVRTVDLVDQQDDVLVRLQRLQQRPPQQELPAEQLARVASRLRRADREQLTLVVPVVDGVVEVDPLMALEPDQARAGRRGERPRDLRLADARLPLQQQRLLEGDRQVDGGREAPVGEVALPDQRPLDVLDGAEPHAAAAASSNARRHSTRARWRL